MKLASLFEQLKISHCWPIELVINSVINLPTSLTVYEDYDGDELWPTTITGKCIVTDFLVDDYDHEYDEHYYDSTDNYHLCDRIGLNLLNDPHSTYWAFKYDLEKMIKNTNSLLIWKEVLP